MEIWRERRLSLENLKETKKDLTEGQSKALTELIQEVTLAEIGLPNLKKIRKISKGLIVGQHLEEPELIDFLKQISPKKKK